MKVKKYKRKPYGYWENKENIRTAVKQIMEEHSVTKVPSSSQLREWKRTDVDNAISSHFGGYEELRIDFGEEIPVLYGDGDDIEKLKERAVRYMQEHGYKTLPGRKTMYADGQGALETSIAKLKGGIRKFRELLGVPQIAVERGKWQDLSFRIEKAREAMEKDGVRELQSSRRLAKLGYSYLSHAIRNNDGSFKEFRRLMKKHEENEILKKWNLEKTLEAAYKFVKSHPEYNGLLPRDGGEYEKHRQGELYAAIDIPCRGFDKFEEMLLNYMERKDGYNPRDLHDPTRLVLRKVKSEKMDYGKTDSV